MEYRKRYQERQRQLQRAQLESRFESEEHVHSSSATLASPDAVSPPSSALDDEHICRSTELLGQDFMLRKYAWSNFPPDISSSDIRRSVLRFREII
ncbi:hypothetical protein VTN31DRAFT_54 [Thermomyces dupontii]|uniref:uncharacterized protein n=1 Tax=Talaromyces thermophilus TaxID=28565 RepID=UPI0037420521